MESTSRHDLAEHDQLVGTESRAKRDRAGSGKPQLSLVLEFRNALLSAAKGLEEGVAKYGRGNWRKGFPAEEICDSLANHLTAYLSGELIDPDSATGATHLEKVLCNALMLVELHNVRPEPPPKPLCADEGRYLPTCKCEDCKTYFSETTRS